MNRLMMFMAGWNACTAFWTAKLGLPLWLALGAVIIAGVCLLIGLSPVTGQKTGVSDDD